MKIVIALDSFKGSLSSRQASEATRRGLAKMWPEADYQIFPIADGGEGLVEAMVSLSGGHLLEAKVLDPLGRPITASWGLLGDGRTAVIEAAASSGLTLLSPKELNPISACTFGLGQLIQKALEYPEVERILIGLGGSATNDGGAGMLRALGIKFLNSQMQAIPPGGGGLEHLDTIDVSGLHPRLNQVQIVVACDVSNPLTGPNGASAVFGPQKGANPDMVKRLDLALSHYASKAQAATGRDVAYLPGAGAAGGLGCAFMFFTAAEFRPGVELVLKEGDFLNKAAGAALIITGEGRSDIQTSWGKAPAGVAALGRTLGIPTIILSGALGNGYHDLYSHNIAGLMSIAPGPISLAESMDKAAVLLEDAAERLAHLLSIQLKTSPNPGISTRPAG